MLLLLAVTLAIAGLTLAPFDLAPPNAVSWAEPPPGLVFSGAGIAATDDAVRGILAVELLLFEPRESPNWGDRVILEIANERANPPLVIGELASRLFAYSRYAAPGEPRWQGQLRPEERLPRDRDVLVAVSYAPAKSTVFFDGREVARGPGLSIPLAGRLILGNDAGGRRGWWGTIRGVALYERPLSAEDTARHAGAVARDGIGALAVEAGLVALYAPAEGARAISPDAAPLRVPERFRALPGSMLRWPGDGPRSGRENWVDIAQNLVLYAPFGFAMARRLRRRGSDRARALAWSVLAGLALSSGIELLQLFLPSRGASTLDIACNGAGALVGAWVRLSRRG